MINKIEALADAIGKLNGCPSDPESEAYRLRNPLLIHSFARPGKHETDDKGRRVFTSFLNGYKAGLFDLELKISGNSRSNITKESTLTNLLGCYLISGKASVDYVVSFLRRALGDQNINGNTPMSYFMEEVHGG